MDIVKRALNAPAYVTPAEKMAIDTAVELSNVNVRKGISATEQEYLIKLNRAFMRGARWCHFHRADAHKSFGTEEKNG